MAQAVEYHLCMHEALGFKPQYHWGKKKTHKNNNKKQSNKNNRCYLTHLYMYNMTYNKTLKVEKNSPLPNLSHDIHNFSYFTRLWMYVPTFSCLLLLLFLLSKVKKKIMASALKMFSFSVVKVPFRALLFSSYQSFTVFFL
jgi:hypothetical protein